MVTPRTVTANNDANCITGGALNERSVLVKIHPIGSGLTWNPKESSFQWEGKEEIRKDYHHINIRN
ncbi:hypothetical protein KKI90_20895 [Xenorhabdus bovienii]|uniref:hypothetical protein n=1 Tax=Xenorhabdus bovienii TaxID=40576 RepID=UPI00237CDC28|nr:hypothetical protein [Xenorhabdus bovienii]MDE1488736.1 hypothetical protein [Xenorhabdus bovienii]MDE9479579.1 hypothetical protein [Xenorhabdus bovienii]MDE9532451.1 hypothetical protein [Xenorhabdus bovienii]